ncbi:G-box-binding factor-like isoform X2 [Acanthaster planci]|uniref:G-box-binding factor-like isoform X2 n=1 Tax=Acanthaster planci TaxID=133434 RepID=A0A8B7YH42_ACAPL|nr:G-box-binding factor-like isoform X2 [Acanthaster planci]
MKRPLKMLATPSAPPLSPVGSARDPLSGRLQQLGEELQCPLCLEYYEDPVALPCLHNFCRKCIGGAVKPSGANKQEVQCPLCRKKAYHDGSANSCVANLPRNFQIAGIVEKFRAAEKEKQRAEEEQFQPQVLEQIEEIREQQEHCSLQEQQQHRQKQQQGQQQLQEDQQAPSCTSSIDLYSPSNSVETTSANERVAPSSTHPPKIPQCKLCSYSSAFQCTECGEDFCLHCQQIHHHEGSIAFQEEFNSDELEKTASGPTSTPCDEGDGEEQQQHLQQLQEKQQHLQLELEQQRALSDFTPAPFWQQQQADRWEELQEKQGTRRQVSEEYPPRQHQSDGNSMPHEPLSWPLGHHSQEVYQQQHHRDLLQHPPASTVRYPHPEHQQQFSPYSLPSQLNCSHCKYPAAIRCEQCSSYFCWQCKGDLHDPYMCENHNTVDLSLAVSPSSPCIVGPEQDVKNYDFPSATRIPLVSIAPAVPNNVGTTSLGVERKLDYISHQLDVQQKSEFWRHSPSLQPPLQLAQTCGSQQQSPRQVWTGRAGWTVVPLQSWAVLQD